MTTFDEWFSKQEGPAWHELELRWGRHIAKVAWDEGYAQALKDTSGERQSTAPALTRADILRWPESAVGRLREECARIAGGRLDANRYPDSFASYMFSDSKGAPLCIEVSRWQPNRDANHCKMVMDALAKDRWQWDIGNTGEQCYAALWHRDKGEVKVGYDELPGADWLVKVCVAACIAKLARAT